MQCCICKEELDESDTSGICQNCRWNLEWEREERELEEEDEEDE
jgi:hypothetical protein